MPAEKRCGRREPTRAFKRISPSARHQLPEPIQPFQEANMRVVATRLSIIRNRPPIDDGPECERCDEVANRYAHSISMSRDATANDNCGRLNSSGLAMLM